MRRPAPQGLRARRVLGASGSTGPRRAASGWLTIGNSAVRHRPQVRRIRRPSSAARRFGSGLLVNPTSALARTLTGEEARKAGELIDRKYPILQRLLVPLGHRLRKLTPVIYELTLDETERATNSAAG